MEKPTFPICWDSVDFDVTFTFFFMALGPILMTLGALETGLKFDDFLWLSRGARAEGPLPV